MRIDQGSQSGAALVFYAIRAGQAFAATQAHLGAPGNVSQVQLFMPAAATVNAYITRLLVWAATGQSIQVNRYDTDINLAVVNGANQNLGGATSSLKLNTNTNPAVPLGTQISQFYTPALTSFQISKDFLFRISPGKGLVIAGIIANDFLGVSAEWVEFPL